MVERRVLIVGVPMVAIGIYLLKSFMQGGQCTTDARLDGKVVIITGSNTGIGKANALGLVQRGARVILACRSEQKGSAAAEEIRNITGETGAKVKFMKLDLASLKSIKAFAEEFKKSEKRLDILINNAGILGVPFSRTEDGFEQTFGVNHLGHFYLTHLLLDVLKQSAPSRIVNLSGDFHGLVDGLNFDDLMGEKSYNSFYAYCYSKLANILFTRELAKRLEGTGVTSYAVHPGVIITGISRYMWFLNLPGVHQLCRLLSWPFVKDLMAGAQTQICCSVDPALASSSGKYYSDCAEVELNEVAKDDAAAKKLWDVSTELVGLKPENMVV